MGLGCTNQCFSSNIVCLNGRKYYINPSYPVYVAANNNCGGNCGCCGQNNGNLIYLLYYYWDFLSFSFKKYGGYAPKIIEVLYGKA